jgi:hypothetical protein
LHGLSDQFEFRFERRGVLPRRKRLDRAPAGQAGRRAADDFLQRVEFKKLFCGVRDRYLVVEVAATFPAWSDGETGAWSLRPSG